MPRPEPVLGPAEGRTRGPGRALDRALDPLPGPGGRAGRSGIAGVTDKLSGSSTGGAPPDGLPTLPSPAEELHRRRIETVARRRCRKGGVGGDQDRAFGQCRSKIKTVADRLIEVKSHRLNGDDIARRRYQLDRRRPDRPQGRAGELAGNYPRRVFAQRTLAHSTINRSGASSGSRRSSAPAAADPSSSITHSARRWHRRRPSCLVPVTVAPQILGCRNPSDPADHAADLGQPLRRRRSVHADCLAQRAPRLLFHRGAAPSRWRSAAMTAASMLRIMIWLISS